MERHNIEFHLTEYSCLRTEILQYSRQRINAVVYSVVANATIIAFIITNVQSSTKFGSLMTIAAWLPLLMVIIGWVHYYDNVRNVNRIAGYCKLLEARFAARMEELGWELYIDKRRTWNSFRARYVYNTLFLIQFCLSIYIGILVTSSLHTP